MKVTPAILPDVLVIEPTVHTDDRGDFRETWHDQRYRDAGIAVERFVQDNQARSRSGVLRGLHYQLVRPQGKLVWVVQGEVFDVVVDLRRSSATFGQWAGVVLSGERQQQLWVPPGFAHGYYVTSESAILAYKCTEFYAAEHDRTLRWDDSDVGVRWPLRGTPRLSAKDAAGASLRDAPTYP